MSKSVHCSAAIIPVAVADDVAVRTTPLTAVAVTVSNHLAVVARLYHHQPSFITMQSSATILDFYPTAQYPSRACYEPACSTSFSSS